MPFHRNLRKLCGGLSVAALTLPILAQDLSAQSAPIGKTERYVPMIWVDPDGCEHWVMDDGAEGYGDNRLRRDGTPVCRTGPPCAIFGTDQLFATDKWRLGRDSRARLTAFFRQADAKAFVISGHTDSVASDAYNLALSERRARAVAEVANSAGGKIREIRWYGERNPVASNETAPGRQKNRRVEIECLSRTGLGS